MTMSDRLIAAVAAALMTPGAPGAATARETAPEPRTEGVTSDDKLSAFVGAAIDLSEVSESYRRQMDMAEDEATRRRLREEQTDAVLEAVERTDGTTVEEYVAIIQAAQADEALDQRITDRWQEEIATD